MVKRASAALLLFGVATGRPAFSKLSPLSIDSVTVVRTGIYNGSTQTNTDAVKSCSSVRVSDSQVKMWLKRAMEVPKDGFQERATITGCSLSGYLITVKGQRLGWELDIGGASVVHLPPPADALYLVGPEVWKTAN